MGNTWNDSRQKKWEEISDYTWETVRLGELGNFQTGGTPSRSNKEYFNGTIPFITTTALGSLYVCESRINEYITDIAIKESSTKIVPLNSLLIGTRVGVGKASINTMLLCTNQDILAITEIDQQKVYLPYLHNFLKTKLQYFNSQKRGATIQGIKAETVKEIDVPLPPMSVQQKIADILDRAAALIEKRKAQISKLDSLVKSQFIEIFGDPVTNTKEWEIKRLDQIADSRLGKMLDAKKQTGENPYPYLANFNVQWFRFDLDKLNVMDFNEADRVEFALEYGDLLVCEGGEVGRTAIWKNERQNCFFQKAIHRVRCKSDVCTPEYLAWVMFQKAMTTNFDGLVSGVTIAHLTGVKLKGLQIQVPPLDLQNRFADFVRAADKSKFEMWQGLSKLELLYKSLMQKCFNGESD